MDNQHNLNNQNTLPLEREDLKEKWIDLMQKLSGDIWTDYNAHDPGITIIEELCDVITDIFNATSTPIQNLLNSQSRKKREEINNAFYDAVEILPTNPVTITDYRIMIIDRVQYVKNAWIEPVEDNMLGMQGLYRVLLQIDEQARTPSGIASIKDEVFSLFNLHRNLCEDLESIQILDIDKLEVFADIDISTEVVAEEVLAEILFLVEEHLNPSIKFHTLEDLIEEGYLVDDIFDGPLPVHGIVKKSDLAPIRQEVYVSKIIELIQSVEGVRRISYFRIDQNGIPIDGDVIMLRTNTYPVLDMDTIDDRFREGQSYPVQFFRGALNYELDLNTANQLLYSMYAKYKKGYQMKMLYHEKDFPSTISLADIGRYNSMQNSLPITYGVNELGLPDYAKGSRERYAMIKQLRGYLLFFEQQFINYLEQLTNVKRLFSIDKDVDRTYFTDMPDDLPGILDIMQAANIEQFKKKLASLTATFDPYIDRRNRFLDHLLSRFGERFSTDFLLKVSKYLGIGDDDEDTDPELELINAKIEFLQNYVSISRNRGKGFDYLKSDEDDWNVSGLEKRACLLLDIKNTGNESLVEAIDGKKEEEEPFILDFDYYIKHVHTDSPGEFINLDNLHEIETVFDVDGSDIGIKEDLTKLLEELDGLIDDIDLDFLVDDESIDLNDDDIEDTDLDDASEDDYATKFVFRAKNRERLIRNLLTYGIKKYNYIVLPTDGRKSFSIYYKGYKKLGVFKIREVSTKLAAGVEIKKLIKYLHKINQYSEGMHVVEHILLRPQAIDKHGFILIDDKDDVLLQSYEYSDIDQQRGFADDIPLLAINEDAFRILILDDNSYQIVLMNNNDQYIATFPNHFKEEDEAKEQILDIIDYVRSFKNSDVSIFERIKFTTKDSISSDVDPSFFSLNMSIVLPTWPSRFQNSDFQDLLRKVIVLNAPVHLHVEFVWLNSNQMREFESIYFNWLESRVATNPQQPHLDERAKTVMDFLLKYKN